MNAELGDEVAILVALYDGEAYLEEQLDSFTAQTHTNWSVVVSDDGSSDTSPDIVRRFAKQVAPHKVTLMTGPGLGYAANFLGMLLSVGPDVAYAALSDQDDVWYAQKLTWAVDALKAVPADTPALYCSRTEVCAEDLQPRGVSPHFTRPPSFANALVQNIAGGNTIVLNRAALNLVQIASRNRPQVISHDWWVYQLVTGAGGRVLFDPRPTLKYRQHGSNIIGANSGHRARLTRMGQMLAGRYRQWNDVNLAALSEVVEFLTPENRDRLTAFKAARHGGLWSRLTQLRRAGVYRQTGKGSFALGIAALLNRI